jgi:hypothetical protein
LFWPVARRDAPLLNDPANGPVADFCNSSVVMVRNRSTRSSGAPPQTDDAAVGKRKRAVEPGFITGLGDHSRIIGAEQRAVHLLECALPGGNPIVDGPDP